MSAQISHPNFPRGLDINPFILGNGENGSSFDEQAQKRAIQRFGIAGRIWEAAELMIRYFQLSESFDWQFEPPCSIIRREDERELAIVELGSGTGYVGMKLAEQLSRLGRERDLIVLTDLPDVCALLEETLYDEKQRWMTLHLTDANIVPVKIVPLPWGDIAGANQLSYLLNVGETLTGESRFLTHIVCSDLVYFPHLLAPLLRTLLQLTSPPFVRPVHSPVIIISYKIRSLSKETAFWVAFGLWFTFSPVFIRRGTNRGLQEVPLATEEGTEDERNWRIFGSEGYVFVGHRRLESFDWAVPDSDSDLLAGVGAQGSEVPKSDDTFESLLMMQLDI